MTATVAEEVMSSPDFVGRLAELRAGDWPGTRPGLVDGPTPGLRIQIFPADAELPALAAAVDVSPASPIYDVLAEAMRVLTGDPARAVATAEVDVVRYRPGARCVVRYRVTTRAAADRAALDEGRRHIVFGKLYRQTSAALAAHRLAEQLWRITPPEGPAYLPRPLTVVAHLALVLSEEVGGNTAAAVTVAGKTLLQPALGAAAHEAVRSAAEALAWLHTAEVDPGTRIARTAASESRRAEARVDLLDADVHGLESLLRLRDDLLTALAGSDCHRLRLVHGAFRPNQLVFCGPTRAAITDLDGAGSGDPAVDVGDFCAHLRPRGLWSGRAGHRAWWEGARAIFTDRYRDVMIRAGAVPDELAATLRRASLFEASALLKMAGHRSRRLSSMRPREVTAMVTEAAACVARYSAWNTGTR